MWHFFAGIVISALFIIFNGSGYTVTVEPNWVYSVNEMAPNTTDNAGTAFIEGYGDVTVNFN